MNRTDTPTLIAELRYRALLFGNGETKAAITAAADRLEEQEKLIGRARDLLKEWGLALTDFASAPYIESEDFLAATVPDAPTASEGEAQHE